MRNFQKNAVAAGLTALLCVALFHSATVYAQTYKGFSVGQYQGQARNKTGNNIGTGKATLEIRSIANDGSVQAYLRDSDGLEGAGALAGAINDNGVMQLSGPMTSPSDNSVWQSALMAVMQNGQLRMGNRLTLGNAVQEETATMAYAGGGAPVRPVTAAYAQKPTVQDIEKVMKGTWAGGEHPASSIDAKMAVTVNAVQFGQPYRATAQEVQVEGFPSGGMIYPVIVDFTQRTYYDSGTRAIRMGREGKVYKDRFGGWAVQTGAVRGQEIITTEPVRK